ncbi:MAG: hypothetical protein G01um101420_281 [Parcubacteria group bacterium Gr01-1014_20]|nr:MAG: hypothetical protein G01um101420_281 [Parcubacteria group bacterium Gr01-1014_20]
MSQKRVQLFLGFWLVISPWVLGFSSISIMKWSNVIVGTIIFLINLWAVFGKEKSTTPPNS